MTSVPVPFSGSAAEAEANRATHYFPPDPDGDSRCSGCDCRPSHAAAEYPCGEEPPRTVVGPPAAP